MRNPTRTPEGTKCTYCSEPAVCHDHYIPRCLGGGDGENLVPSCDRCNWSKGRQEPWYWAGAALTSGLLGGPQSAWQTRIEAVLDRSPEMLVDMLEVATRIELNRYQRAAIEMSARAEVIMALIEKAKASL